MGETIGEPGVHPPDSKGGMSRRRLPALFPAGNRVALLPLVGLIPSFLLATYALTLPWACGRAFIVWRISRSPGAALLLSISLAGMVAASLAVAIRGRRRRLAGAVHLAMGVLMCGVAYAAFAMVRDAGMKLLFVPVVSIRPGAGLRLFLLAALLVLALGALELLIPALERRRSRRDNRRRFMEEGTPCLEDRRSPTTSAE
ncbi:MAG: hypothetical protein FJY88_05350 [Candidatus Eisenbacteria bacterium]|nr:hypothetical protein [Candidatus Eisenbacteria bacterium]